VQIITKKPLTAIQHTRKAIEKGYVSCISQSISIILWILILSAPIGV
jgi:hypothetical protein